MKIIYKTSANKEQLEARESIFCNGIEIQMINKDEDLSNILKCEQKVHSIHYPYRDKECYIHNIINKTDEYFERALQYAQKFGAAIILHNENSLEEIRNMDRVKVNNLIKLIKRYPEVKISIENVTIKKIAIEKDNTMEIPKICEYLNGIAEKEIFFPLLDICHLLQVRNISIENLEYSLADALIAFQSPYFNIHLNYIHGAGEGNNHGVTFASNELLLNQILNLLVMNNIKANLILEVAESDYVKCENAKEVHTTILKLLNRMNALHLIEN